MITINVASNRMSLTGDREMLTSGSVRVNKVQFTFDEAWDGLQRTAIFRAGYVSKTTTPDENGECWIPSAVMKKDGVDVFVGVQGTLNGDIVIPTIWLLLGHILPGAEIDGDCMPIVLNVDANGRYDVSDYDEVDVNVRQPEGEVTITENGTHDVEWAKTASVDVRQPEGEVTITENGTHDVKWAETADVQVPVGVFPSGEKTIKADGTYDVTEIETVVVDVISDTEPVKEITENGRYDVTNQSVAYVNVPCEQMTRVWTPAGYFNVHVIRSETEDLRMEWTENRPDETESNGIVHTKVAIKTGFYTTRMRVHVKSDGESEEKTMFGNKLSFSFDHHRSSPVNSGSVVGSVVLGAAPIRNYTVSISMSEDDQYDETKGDASDLYITVSKFAEVVMNGKPVGSVSIEANTVDGDPIDITAYSEAHVNVPSEDEFTAWTDYGALTVHVIRSDDNVFHIDWRSKSGGISSYADTASVSMASPPTPPETSLASVSITSDRPVDVDVNGSTISGSELSFSVSRHLGDESSGRAKGEFGGAYTVTIDPLGYVDYKGHEGFNFDLFVHISRDADLHIKGNPSRTLNIASNGVHDVSKYASANVTVPNPSKGTLDIDSNGAFDVTQYASVNVNVQKDVPTEDDPASAVCYKLPVPLIVDGKVVKTTQNLSVITKKVDYDGKVNVRVSSVTLPNAGTTSTENGYISVNAFAGGYRASGSVVYKKDSESDTESPVYDQDTQSYKPVDILVYDGGDGSNTGYVEACVNYSEYGSEITVDIRPHGRLPSIETAFDASSGVYYAGQYLLIEVPSKQNDSVGFVGVSVTINGTPIDTIQIANDGTHDVTNASSAVVSVGKYLPFVNPIKQSSMYKDITEHITGEDYNFMICPAALVDGALSRASLLTSEHNNTAFLKATFRVSSVSGDDITVNSVLVANDESETIWNEPTQITAPSIDIEIDSGSIVPGSFAVNKSAFSYGKIDVDYTVEIVSIEMEHIRNTGHAIVTKLDNCVDLRLGGMAQTVKPNEPMCYCQIGQSKQTVYDAMFYGWEEYMREIYMPVPEGSALENIFNMENLSKPGVGLMCMFPGIPVEVTEDQSESNETETGGNENG